MGRSLVLSNGSLHVGLDEHGRVSDFYYPHVGSENHITGMSMHHRIGVWTDEGFSWLGRDWTVTARFEDNALVGRTVATNERLGIRLEFTDAVYSGAPVLIRSIHVFNLRGYDRGIRLFTHQLFAIGESLTTTDTAQYLPENDALLHYRGRRAFVIGGTVGGRPFDQHSIGLFGIEGHEGTYRDAEDGELGNNAVEHGRVDSVLRFGLTVEAHGSARVDYWIAAGRSVTAALDLHDALQKHGVHGYLQETANWWKRWLAPALKVAAKVSDQSRRHFLESLMIVKAHQDGGTGESGGAVIASTDTSMLNYARDAYAYCWPRDGALAMWPLIRLGYRDEPLAFFRFIARVIHPGGYVSHKYFADGSLGPSWHPYVHGEGEAKITSAPIQTDETAIVLFMLAQAHEAFSRSHPATGLLDEFYETLVLPMANFLAGYIDDATGLPKPSYDLWEEVFATSTYTVACTYGALCGAAELADAYGQTADSLRWRSAADELRLNAHKRLFNPETDYFYKGIHADGPARAGDPTVDSSSLYGALTFGLYDAGSREAVAAAKTYRTALVGERFDGVARYQNDCYNQNSNSGTGNPWYICSLWLAQIYGRCNESDAIIDWVNEGFSQSGILAEQADRVTRAPLSVAPLTWSHAEYVNTMLDFLNDTEFEGDAA